MGSYNTAVITTVGQALLTSVLGSQGTMTFTKLQTSSYAYASGTDLSALTSLNNVEQEANIGTATIVDSTHIAADATISNSGVTTEYNANTLGIFASDGDNEVLFAVSTAVTPDVIPVDSGGTPSTYKYNFTLAVSSTSDITISAVGNIDASDVAYDNTVSGLSATNVQGVIDEVVVEKASQRELSNLVLTGTTNTSGATISAGTCFVLNGDFVTAKADIASGATFTLNTNYEKKSVGSILTELNSNLASNNFGAEVDLSSYTSSGTYYEFPSDGYVIISNQASTSGMLKLFIRGNDNTNGPLISVEGDANPDKYSSLFVKKGMRVYILVNTLNSTKTCIYRPVV